MSYLLSDKTGTLTCNLMVFKKLHLGSAAYTEDTFDEVAAALAGEHSGEARRPKPGGARRPDQAQWLVRAVEALALCHNVTPVYDEPAVGEEGLPEAEQAGGVTYQAASPDEVALVEWAGSMGLRLAARTLTAITLTAPQGTTLAYDILQVCIQQHTNNFHHHHLHHHHLHRHPRCSPSPARPSGWGSSCGTRRAARWCST